MTSSALSHLENETLEFAQQLIAIPSVNNGVAADIGDEESQAVQFIADRLTEVGYQPQIAEEVPGRASLSLKIPGNNPEVGALVLHAHVDVVPAEGSDWTHPPFGGEVHDGFLWGRGAVDMKGFAASLLALARHFKREQITPARDLIFCWFSDEEQGGTHGAQWIAAHHPEWFSGATESLSEVGGFSVPLGNSKRAYLLATAEKGVGWITLTAHGTAGHASKPTVDNPVVKIAQAVSTIGSHHFPIVRTAALDAFLDAYSTATGIVFAEDTLEKQLDELDPIVSRIIKPTLRNTATPTVINAGYSTNVIPSTATAHIDCRVIPGEEKALKETISELVGADIEVTWKDIPPIEAPVTSPLVEALSQAIAVEDPDGLVVPYLLPASTDNKHLNVLGINGYGFTPLKVPADFDVFGNFHAVDERVPVAALHFSSRVLARALGGTL